MVILKNGGYAKRHSALSIARGIRKSSSGSTRSGDVSLNDNQRFNVADHFAFSDYYNYDSSLAFNYSSYPVGRFANEFGYHSMPSLQTWQQAIPPQDLHFNSTTIELRNHHYPPGGLNISNFANTTKGMGEMTIAAQRWYPVSR